MATWNTRGLRGSTLEELINYSNEIYRDKKLGLVQKIPTPITPVKIDKENGNISLAYFEKDSTVQGVPICFDAKECASDTFSLNNIHEHQIKFMDEFENQQGISFLVIMFSLKNEFYYMRFSELKGYLDRVKEGHAKNFKYNELDKKYFIPSEAGVVVHYLRTLMKDLEERRN